MSNMEPFKTKTVRPITFTTVTERKSNLVAANFNVFNLTPKQINFDLVSHGTAATSQEQLSGLFIGDESYAGSINFSNLHKTCQKIFGHTYLVPAHNLLGCYKVLLNQLKNDCDLIVTNSKFVMKRILKPRQLKCLDLRDHSSTEFPGNLNINELENTKCRLIIIQTFSDGKFPFSLSNLNLIRSYCDQNGIILIVDSSMIVENAWYIQKYDIKYQHLSVKEIVKEISSLSHIQILDGNQAKCAAGGIITCNNPVYYEFFMNDVVIYEGLHTYGGISGRGLEVLSLGIQEMVNADEVDFYMNEMYQFANKLKQAGIPLERGADGVYIACSKFLPHIKNPQLAAYTLAGALYYVSGMRALPASNLDDDNDILKVQIPKFCLSTTQLNDVINCIIQLYKEKDSINSLEIVDINPNDSVYASFRGSFVNLNEYKFDCVQPYVVHTFERIKLISSENRHNAIKKAGYNTFLLQSSDVTIDLLTDSGTSAMSINQWSQCLNARENFYTVSEPYYDFVHTFSSLSGYKFVIPTHQGRSAEHIMSEVLIKANQIVPGNMYFTTTKLHQEMAGGKFVDVIVDEAHNPQSDFNWKGNISIDKLNACINEYGSENIPYVSFEFAVNMAGGQPVSMDNLRQVKEICSQNNILVMFDATRCAENAYMIQLKDPNYHNSTIKEILLEMFQYGDGCTISGKKDFLINIGGALCYRDRRDLYDQSNQLLLNYEGEKANGGLCVADIACMNQGLIEMIEDNYIKHRVQQTQSLGKLLLEANIPIVTPIGSHAVFIDAKKFLDHLPQSKLPAQALAAEIFLECGVRTMERGIVSKGRNPVTGLNYEPKLELVRLTIPRRVYSYNHMKFVANGVINVFKRRREITGLKFIYEPKCLRFFQSRFEKL